MKGMDFGFPSVLRGLACLLCFFLDPVSSQGPCELSNLVTITATGSVPVINLDQQLCFGCVFPTGVGFGTIPVPLGTEWTITPSEGSTMVLSNSTVNEVTISGVNGTVLFESPSSLLTFETTQIGCSYDSDEFGFLSLIATLNQAVLNPPYVIGVNEAGETYGIEGETVTLSCTNYGPSPGLSEQMAWLDSKGTLLTSFSLLQPQILTLANVTRDQSGVYTCLVHISFGGESLKSSVNTTLIVQYPALILSGPVASPSPTLYTEENLTLSCNFEGIPAPNVTWTVNGSNLDVDGNDKLSVQTIDGSTQLIFNPVINGDNGLYQCAVDNGIGSPSVSTSVNVIVQVPDEPVSDNPTVVSLGVTDMSTKLLFLEWTLGFNGLLVFVVVGMNMW